MVTRTYYFPRNQIGRYIINYIVERVGCSIGNFHVVADSIAVVMTVQPHDVVKVERILQMYGLIET